MNLTEFKELIDRKIEDLKHTLGDDIYHYYGDPEEGYSLGGELEAYEQVKKWLEGVK